MLGEINDGKMQKKIQHSSEKKYVYGVQPRGVGVAAILTTMTENLKLCRMAPGQTMTWRVRLWARTAESY